MGAESNKKICLEATAQNVVSFTDKNIWHMIKYLVIQLWYPDGEHLCV